MLNKIYIAGPMRNIPRYNFDEFEKWTRTLRDMGFTVISPHEHDLEMGFNPDNKDYTSDPDEIKEMILWDCRAVAECDAIFLLDGWEDSRGVAVELALAHFLNKAVLKQNELQAFSVLNTLVKRELVVA